MDIASSTPITSMIRICICKYVEHVVDTRKREDVLEVEYRHIVELLHDTNEPKVRVVVEHQSIIVRIRNVCKITQHHHPRDPSHPFR